MCLDYMRSSFSGHPAFIVRAENIIVALSLGIAIATSAVTAVTRYRCLYQFALPIIVSTALLEMYSLSSVASRDYGDTARPRLRNDAFTKTLQRKTREAEFRMLNLGDIVDVLQ